jgi:hypothetical protein
MTSEGFIVRVTGVHRGDTIEPNNRGGGLACTSRRQSNYG